MEDACPHTSGTSTFYICSSYDLTVDFQVQTAKKFYRFKLYLDLGWFIAFEFCNTFCTLCAPCQSLATRGNHVDSKWHLPCLI